MNAVPHAPRFAPIPFCRWLCLIGLGALALRIGIRLVVGIDDYWTDGYGLYPQLAQSLCAGHGYAFADTGPTAFRVPLYPMLVAVTTCGVGSPWPLIAAQALASSGTAVLAGLIARRMAGDGPGLIAAAAYALWPYGAWHDVSLQESGLHAFLAALATWLLLILRDRRRIGLAMLSGAVLGLMLLTRATMLPFALCALGVVAFNATGRKRVVLPLIVGALMLAVLSPWLTWSKAVTGSLALGTEGGAALYTGNHPLTFSAYPDRSIDESRANVFAALSPQDRGELARLGPGEAAQDRWFRNKALQNIASDPLAFAIGALRKVWAAFGPLPVPRHGTIGNLGYAAGWVPLFTLAIIGMARRRKAWRDDLLLHAHMATFCLTAMLFWAQTSHRSYLDPYLCVFAAVAIASSCRVQRLVQRRCHPDSSTQALP